MEDKLVVLELFSDETEAAVVKGFLEANDITACIFDNDPAHRFSFRRGTNLDFAIRLMVGSSDLQAARELLDKKEIL
ncbi:MAG: DUF2007 domain-containing protein [Candidatus Omnitrophota bacterium]